MCYDPCTLFTDEPRLQTDSRLYVALTLQDVHPDQFRSLRSTPDLPLEIVLGLEKETFVTITHFWINTIFQQPLLLAKYHLYITFSYFPIYLLFEANYFICSFITFS